MRVKPRVAFRCAACRLVHAVLRRSGTAVCFGVVLGLLIAASAMQSVRGLPEAVRFASGVGLALGAGAEYFFLPHRSLVISVNRWSGHYDEIEQGVDSTPVDIDASTVRFTIGIDRKSVV